MARERHFNLSELFTDLINTTCIVFFTRLHHLLMYMSYQGKEFLNFNTTLHSINENIKKKRIRVLNILLSF